MKRAARVGLVAGLIGSLVVPAGWAQEPATEVIRGLQVSLDAPDRLQSYGKSITLEVHLRNVSDRPFSVYRHLSSVRATPGFVVFHVRPVGGVEIPVVQAIDKHAPPTASDYVRLEPGASLKRRIKLDEELWSAGSIRPGSYDIWLDVTLSNEGVAAGVIDAWAGTVRSNAVTIDIV